MMTRRVLSWKCITDGSGEAVEEAYSVSNQIIVKGTLMLIENFTTCLGS